MSKPINAAGTTFTMTKVFKQPRHGKSNIDAQGGRFKGKMRHFERTKGSFMIKDIDDFLQEAENGHQCFYDAEKKVYRANFSIEEIRLNDGSMAYNPSIFKQLRDKPVVKDGLVYKSGIRDTHGIKVVNDPVSDEIVYAISLSPCPTACSDCYGSGSTYCNQVVSRYVSFPRQKILKATKLVQTTKRRSEVPQNLNDASPSKRAK